MKVFVTLSAIFAIASAQGYNNYGHQGSPSSSIGATQQKPPIPILKSESVHNHDGSYNFEYETGNGIQAAEHGYVKSTGQKDGDIQVAEGYFQYTSDDGHPISLKYVADENGFQPIGDHLPTPPPLPKEIIEALAKIAADPRQNDGDDGQYRKEQHGAGQAYQQQQQQPGQQYYKY